MALAAMRRFFPLLLLLFVISSYYIVSNYKLPVLEWHECDEARDSMAGSPRHWKHSSIVQSSIPAGRGIPGRIQCSDDTDLSQQQQYRLGGGMSRDHPLVLVTMFVPSATASPCVLERQFAVLRVFLESAKSAMPYASQVVLVDPVIGVLGRDVPRDVRIEAIPGNYSRANLMLQRLETYRAFLDLHGEEGRRDFIFADSDMMLLADLGKVFEESPHFDVALTYRNNREQPINSGLVFVRASSRTSLVRAGLLLSEVVRSYRHDFMGKSRMMGDQLAFARVVFNDSRIGKHGVDETFDMHLQHRNLTLALLPCSLYNWTPPEGAGQFHGMPVHVKVIHFKGSRKRLMLEAWQRHENPHSMKCFVLRSGRAKYDF